MKANHRDPLVQNLREIYPEHEWIDLKSYPDFGDRDVSPSTLNLQCLAAIATWIEQTLGLDCQYEFPYLNSERDNLVSELCDGFALRINEAKVVFIPSQNIDLDGCEIPQEWVDLPNWSGDYYVPIQVDLEAKYLHLWGSITHQQLTQTARLDPLFRYYHVAAAMTANLDVLWASCELTPLPQADRCQLAALDPTQAHQAIDRLVTTPLPNFPRLLLPFSEWGTLLDDRHYFDEYLQTRSISRDRPPATQPHWLNLSDWMGARVATLDRHWETLEHFLNPPQPQMAMRGLQHRLRHAIDLKNYRDIPLSTPAQIDTQIAQLYANQTEIPLPVGMLGVEDLVVLMENSTDENIRWKAIEYLWIIDPYYPKLPTRHIRDLGIQFTIDSLALMISQLPIDLHRRAILLRVYPMSDRLYLPVGVKLAMFDSNGEPIKISETRYFEAISRSTPQDNYIQLYFVAAERDRFSVRVSLDKQQFTENFIV